MKGDLEQLLLDIREEIPEFPNMPKDNIKEVHSAMFGEMNHEREFRLPQTKSKKAMVVTLSKSDAPKSVQKIMKLAEKYGANTYWMKTGLSVKVENDSGYKLNIMNYLNVKERDGEVSGDVYLNQIRNDRLANPIGGIGDYIWFKGYLCIKKVTTGQLMDLMTKKNMDYLVNHGMNSLNSKKSKATNLKGRLRKGK